MGSIAPDWFWFWLLLIVFVLRAAPSSSASNLLSQPLLRHEKKRALPIDQWDSFIEEIRAWNKPVRMSSQDVLLKS
jgi:hypothetical protein